MRVRALACWLVEPRIYVGVLSLEDEVTGRAFIWLIGKIIIIRDWNNLKFKSPERKKEKKLPFTFVSAAKKTLLLAPITFFNIHAYIRTYIRYKISYEIEFPFWKPALLRLNFNLNIWKHKSGIYCYFCNIESLLKCEMSVFPHTHPPIYFLFLFLFWKNN